MARSRNHRVSNKISPNRTTLRHTIIKMTKIKNKILEATRKNLQVTYYTRIPIKISADFLPETFDTWFGTTPGEGNGYPLQYSRLENPMDRGA